MTGNGNLIRQKNSKKSLFLLVLGSVFLAAILTGCQTLEEGQNSGLSTPTIQTATVVAVDGSETEATSTQAAANTNTLLIWLPPQFDPSSPTPAGIEMKARLDAFHKAYPNLTVDIRLKSPSGRGGLLDSLANASIAAPAAVPDLIALSYRDMESASLKGLLNDLDGKTQVKMDDPDWLPYATRMGIVEGKLYGIPFVGDALALVYRPLQTPYPPTTWQALSTQRLPVIFNVADPDSTVLFDIYLTAGGGLIDSAGMPVLESAALNKTFNYLNNGTKSGAFPVWAANISSFDDVWNSYNKQSSGYAIVWTSQYLSYHPAGTDLTVLPQVNDKPISLAQGWVWSLPAVTNVNQKNALLLAEYLSDTNFVNKLDQLAGYLPVHQSGLTTGVDAVLNQTLTGIADSAQLLPSSVAVNSLSPLLEDSAAKIIKQQLFYQDALNQVLSHFSK